MPTHWTYESVDATQDLIQGDILAPTEELRNVLKEVHPHFLDSKYIAFLVITHSCDLVRRGSQECAARYINIAVVRQIEDVLENFIAHVCKPVVTGVYLQESKGDVKRLLQRLFNQNEQSLGLFYLHPDIEAGISVPSVSLLRVNVALRVDHYEVIQSARAGRLSLEFRGKLGWLVGNLYSRIGTQDWTESKERKKELEKLIQETLDAENPDDAPAWVRSDWVDAALGNGVDLSQLTKTQVLETLEKHKPPTAKQSAIQHVMRIVKDVVPGITEEQAKIICNRLENDPFFAKSFKS